MTRSGKTDTNGAILASVQYSQMRKLMGRGEKTNMLLMIFFTYYSHQDLFEDRMPVMENG